MMWAAEEGVHNIFISKEEKKRKVAPKYGVRRK